MRGPRRLQTNEVQQVPQATCQVAHVPPTALGVRVGGGGAMSSSEARKEVSRVKAQEAEARRAATLERDAVKRQALAASVCIQAAARRRLACKHRAGLYAIARAPNVIRAERFEVWLGERRACLQPGYSASMLAPSKCSQERRRYPWVRKRWGKASPHEPADFILSSLRRSSAKATAEDNESVTSRATSDAGSDSASCKSTTRTSAPALQPSSELLMA